MKTIQLVPHEHEGHGSVGYIPKEIALRGEEARLKISPWDNFGLTAAHDLLEHVNGLANVGLFTADEFEALGCLWWLRGEMTDELQSPYRTPYQVMASEIASCLENLWLNGQDVLVDCFELEQHDGGDEYAEYVDVFEEMYRQGMKVLEGGLDNVDIDELLRTSNATMENVVNLMISGVVKGRKIHDDNQLMAYEQFRAIREAWEDAWPMLDVECYPNVIITYGAQKCFVEIVEEVFDDEDEDDDYDHDYEVDRWNEVENYAW